MARELKVYKCEHCGKMAFEVHGGAGSFACCGENMRLLVAGENDSAAKEKHVPVVTANGNTIEVVVGSVEHPMTEEHLIEWIVLVTDKDVYTHHLNHTDAPKASFVLPAAAKDYVVYEYCNLHGLFKA